MPLFAHDFAEQSVVCYTLCRRCRENAVAVGAGNSILKRQESGRDLRLIRRKSPPAFISRQGVYDTSGLCNASGFGPTCPEVTTLIKLHKPEFSFLNNL